MDTSRDLGGTLRRTACSAALLFICISAFAADTLFGAGYEEPVPGKPSIENYATVESICAGIPIYSFSNLVYIYGVSPELVYGAEMQTGNANPKNKIQPKKSWEIKHNYSGAEHEMTPRNAYNDSNPCLPIHLIDGDPETVWCSFGSHVQDANPEWIRIDLATEQEVASVAMVIARQFSSRYRPVGAALSKEIEITTSKDAWHWEPAYATKDFKPDASGTTVIEFPPRRAKQIWIKVNQMIEITPTGYIYSLGEVEVRNKAGIDLALVSRGSGVTVSSTSYGNLNDRFTQEALWGPLLFDLGNKWVRVGVDNGSVTWSQVEREKGKLSVDPQLDKWITECKKNGVNVIMVLDFKGNWLYANPPRKTNWKETRYRELNDNYTDHPPDVWTSSELMEGFKRYVEYMVGHFKDRVTYFELGNEWCERPLPNSTDVIGMKPEKFMSDFFMPGFEIIKRVAPDAKVMLGSPPGLMAEKILACLGEPYNIGSKLDGIGFHPPAPFAMDQGYFDLIRKLKSDAAAPGFKGNFFASEIYAGSYYPPGPGYFWAYGGNLTFRTELGMAKHLTRILAGHNGLGIEAGPCHPHFTGFPHPQALCRVTWPVQTLTPCQPTVTYYAWRTIATIMDDFYPEDVPVSLKSDKKLLNFMFKSGDSKQRLLLAWADEGPEDDTLVEASTDAVFPGLKVEKAWIIDIMNGTEQELNLNQTEAGTELKGLLIKDYPTYVRLQVE